MFLGTEHFYPVNPPVASKAEYFFFLVPDILELVVPLSAIGGNPFHGSETGRSSWRSSVKTVQKQLTVFIFQGFLISQDEGVIVVLPQGRFN